jgi:hypothetical protein
MRTDPIRPDSFSYSQNSPHLRSVVICHDNPIIDYFALASNSIKHMATSSLIARNMLQPIPLMTVKRLIIDVSEQDKTLAYALLKDALLHKLSVSQHVGICAARSHGISGNLKHLYLKYSFKPSSSDSMTYAAYSPYQGPALNHKTTLAISIR